LEQTLANFCQWLAHTSLSQTIQNVAWIIPSVQSVHILSVAIVMSSVFMVDLRLLGVIGRGYPTASYLNRFFPWVWFTLIVLLATGSILIIGEPARSLQNIAFQAKMIMLILAMIAIGVVHRPIGHEPAFWELSDRRKLAAKAIAVVSLCLFVGIVFAGRWIAYMNTAND
jgi:hypothetical protein